MVRVYDVDLASLNGNRNEEEKMAWLVDPWEWFHRRRLVLGFEEKGVRSVV